MTDTQTTQAAHPLTIISNQLDARTALYVKSLPSHIPADRFKRDVVNAIASNPELLTVDRASLFNSVSRLAGVGLRPDGREAALVVFKDRDRGAIAVAMIMVAGMLRLFRNSGQFKQVAVEVVRDGDKFSYFTDDDGQHIYHEPGDSAGPITKAFALALTKDGGRFIEVMNRAQIDKRRNASRAKDGPMWREWYDEAAQKTVLRSLLKLLPSSSDDLDRLERFDDDDDAPIAPLPPPETQAPPERLSVSSALDKFGGDGPGDVVDPPSTPPNDEAATRRGSPRAYWSPAERAPNADFDTRGTDTAEQAATGQPATDPAMATRLETAHERGVQARKEGMSKRAIPPEYREADRTAEANAWREGWDSAPADGEMKF